MEEPLLKMAAFSPFIQFLAGIYLVFLYDKVLEGNPLQTQVTSITELLNSLVNDNQAYLNEEDCNKVKEFDEKRKVRWGNQFYSLKRASFISFLLCMSVLFYCGIEDLALSKNMEQSLIFPCIIVLIYEIYLMCNPSWKHWSKTCRFAGFLFLLLFIYVVVYCTFFTTTCWLDPWNPTLVYAMLMIAMVFCGICYATNLVYRCFKFIIIQRQIKDLSRTINTLVEIKLSIRSVQELDKKWKDKLLQKSMDTGHPVNEHMDDLIKEEFTSSFNKIIAK